MSKKSKVILVCVLVAICLSVCAVFGLSKNPMGLPRDLINVLIDYLEQYPTMYDIEGYTDEEMIDQIKNGVQPLHVAFDPSEYYYVCGYYKDGEENKAEVGAHRHSKEYRWIKYENADQIREYYLGFKIAVAFQINKPLLVKDLLEDKDYPFRMEHFQIYKTKFVDGVNKNAPIDFAETFIYLNRTGQRNIYRSVKQYDHEISIFRCICFEGQYYIPVHTHTTYPNGEIYDRTDYDCHMFGKYYAEIESIMKTGCYRVENETSHAVHHYGLISVDDFANKIIK